MRKRPDGTIRAFGMSGLQIVQAMSRIEERYAINLGFKTSDGKDRKVAQYEQFDSELRSDAAKMSEYYEIFYCLENSIRKLVSDVMQEAAGADWWNSDLIDEKRIREVAAVRRKKEIDNYMSARSEKLIDYTTFGELCQIITDNWELFAPMFTSKTAVSNVSNQLNLLRGPIAHCSKTDEFEHERLNLAIRSWFRIIS